MSRRRAAFWTVGVLALLVVRAAAGAPKSTEAERKTARGASGAEVSQASGEQKKRSARRGRRGKKQATEEETTDPFLDLDAGAGRGKKGASTPELPATPLALPATPLDGTRWLVDSFRGHDGQPMTPGEGNLLTAQFQPGRVVAGSAGCNDFTAGYTWDAGTLTVSRAATTRKACDKPLMEQEEAYLSALHHAAGFTRNDEGLVLQDGRGAALVTFRRAPPPVITGTVWRMTAFNDGKGGFASARRDVAVSAVFGTDGQLTGSGGCNDYRAKYTQDGDNLTLGAIILLTKKPCAGEIRDQERAFLGTLRSATRIETEGSRLLLTRPGMRIASFTPEAAPAAAPAGEESAKAAAKGDEPAR